MKKTGAWDTERAVALEGALSIAAATVTLTLATDVASTDADVKVSYAKPLTDDENRLEDGDGDGDGVANLTDRAVTNNTAAGHCTGHEAFECAFWQACLTVGAIKSPGGHVSAYGYSRGVGGSLSDTTVEHAGAAHTVVAIDSGAADVVILRLASNPPSDRSDWVLQINSGFGSVRDLKLSDRFHNYGVYEFTWSNVLLSWDGEGDTFPRSVVDVPAARVGRRGAGAGERGVRVRRCGLQLREQRRPDEGAVGHHTVALRRAPDADVTVAIESSDPDAVAVTPASLDLATTKWSAQPVAATAVADATATRRRFGSRTPARGCRRARSR